VSDKNSDNINKQKEEKTGVNDAGKLIADALAFGEPSAIL
jgi:hypothetical protein